MSDAEITTETPTGHSRRTFIKGVIATGAVVSSSSHLFRARSLSASAAVRASMPRMISLNVNGVSRSVDVMPQETLAMTLRYKLGLTGTKLGCDRAECGACTVLIDGVSHYACSLLTNAVRDRSVTSVEGLEGADGTLHPVQQAVIDEGGFQCAFCAPGFIMSMVALTNENPEPTREEAAEALSGNLCRRGDYNKILNSAMRAAEYARRMV
ncbi:MAG: (2Fe-2S)-binding protein [Gemmatimonadales bacterium]|nr:(2Fe-2S)-binding protein [Gemmatimonadales bacterium]